MRVWVTRDEDADGPLSMALQAAGLSPVLEPVITRTVRPAGVAALEEIAAGDWLVLTSPLAVATAATVAAAVHARVAVVGAASAKLARLHGFDVALVGSDGHGETLRKEMAAQIDAGTVWNARSSEARPLARWSSRVTLRDVVLYETVARPFDAGVAARVDVVVCASPSAARSLGKTDLPVASIGRSTSAALRRLGIEPVVEAVPPSFAALAAALQRYASAAR